MKEHPIFSFLEDYLKNPDQEIVIAPANKGTITITVTKKVPESTTLHDAIGLQLDVDFTLKKRAGKKVSQTLSIKHQIPLALNSAFGNPSVTAINRKTDTSIPESD
jgi:hypothetical protein